MDRRNWIQLLTTFIYNANLLGFKEGKIYRGSLKSICVPGLNCYSCPGALGACPLGALQSSLSGIFLKIPFYVIGFLILMGMLAGRLICGWACPFGFFQDLLFKIPSPKIRKSKFTHYLSYLKYFIAVSFLILIPLAYYFITGIGVPAFCKFICPAGTLEAGIPLTSLNSSLRNVLGLLFIWKVFLLIITILASIFVYRPFCRFICPLGAIYSIFNKISLFGIQVDQQKCINCNKCIKICQLDCTKVGDKECINCGKCIKSCPTKAIMYSTKF